MLDSVQRDFLQESRSRLFGYAYALTRDSDDAADLCQDCMLRAMAAPRLPAEERAFRAWLFRTLRNLWIDRMRALRRHRALHEDDGTATEIAAPIPEDILVNQLAVRQAFLQLSKAHRDVLALVDIGGFSYDETSTILDVPRGTVMSRVSRARFALSKRLADSGVTPLDTRRRGASDD